MPRAGRAAHGVTRRAALAAALPLATVLAGLPLAARAQFRKEAWSGATPAFDATDTQQRPWNAQTLRGKAVVLNFWGTWCPPCKAEMPTLEALHQVSGGDTLVIGVNVRDSAGTLRRHLQSAGIGFPVVHDQPGEIARRWGVGIYPTTIGIGADGRARWRVVGEADWSGPEAAGWVAALLQPAK